MAACCAFASRADAQGSAGRRTGTQVTECVWCHLQQAVRCKPQASSGRCPPACGSDKVTLHSVLGGVA